MKLASQADMVLETLSSTRTEPGTEDSWQVNLAGKVIASMLV